MSYAQWFIPVCIGVSIFFAAAVLVLTIATLMFRAKVNKKYDRGNFSG